MPSVPEYPDIWRDNILSLDGKGNTLFHHVFALASPEGVSIEELERIKDQGVKIDQPNKAGRTPLHVLCSTNDYEDHKNTIWILNHTTNADATDEDGIRPLHMACMWSEYLVTKPALTRPLLHSRA